jgi:hypothetical protein
MIHKKNMLMIIPVCNGWIVTKFANQGDWVKNIGESAIGREDYWVFNKLTTMESFLRTVMNTSLKEVKEQAKELATKK